MNGLKQKIEEFGGILEEVMNDLTQIDRDKTGLFYSGGIDSGLLATYYNFKHKLTYKDETGTAADFKKLLPKIIKIIGKPIKSFSPYGWWKLFEEANEEGITTIFSGEGADELFGGYIRYMPDMLNYQAQKEFPSYRDMFPYEYDVNEIGKIEFDNSLQDVLRAQRRLADYWGINIVFPFLDKRIIKFAWDLPPRMKIWDFETKIVLRRLLEFRNPKYQHIEKIGLFCSVNRWLGVENEKFGKETYLELQKEILYGK